MKKLYIVTTLVCVGILFSVNAAQAEERIDSFYIDIEMAEDSSFIVTEEIVYNFDNEQHHGIYREIPYSYERKGAKYNVRINVLSVTDENDQSWQYSLSRYSGLQSIKIGDPDAYITGIKTYKIKYKVERAINYFEDYDELFWNATGTEWQVPIYDALTVVRLPKNVDKEQIQLACYSGSYGSTEQECGYYYTEEGDIAFYPNYSLYAYEGLTIVVGIPKGVVNKPGAWQQIQWFLIDNWPIAVPLVMFIVMFYLWYTRGRDPSVRKTLIPYYEAPDKMTVGVLGTVVDEKVDTKDISATIVQLAIKGYLKIKEIEKKKIFDKGRDYELIKLKEADGYLKDYEKVIFKGIFDVGDTRTISSLKNKFYVHLKKVKKAMYELVVLDGYFPSNPEKVRQTYLGVAIVVMFLGFFLLFFVQNLVAGIAIAVGGAIGIIFSRIMPRKTAKGAEAHSKILGFKWFLSVTETERLKFHNAPSKSPKEFEEFLPYAMVLGVEKEWADQFKDMYVTPPEWYEGSPGHAFGAWYLASMLGSMSTDLNTAMVTAPHGNSTAGFGGSGFGGGGFSGGGFGGGGGGSW